MKRFVTVIAALVALPLAAGVTYQFQSSSNGVRQGNLAGTVFVDGTNVRLDVKSGDNFLFKDNSIVLSNDGGRTLSVFDPAGKTYYVINLTSLLGNSGSLLSSLGASVKFTNPKVAVRNLGAAEPVAGYPTNHSALDASYDINVDMMGNTMTSHMTMTTESWTTDRLSGEFMNFMQMKNMRTGFDDLDKLIEAQSSAINGRFPLKQVTTIHIAQGGADMTTTTTSEVSNVEKKALSAATFAAPAGYTKVDDPITRMTKNLK